MTRRRFCLTQLSLIRLKRGGKNTKPLGYLHMSRCQKLTFSLCFFFCYWMSSLGLMSIREREREWERSSHLDFLILKREHAYAHPGFMRKRRQPGKKKPSTSLSSIWGVGHFRRGCRPGHSRMSWRKGSVTPCGFHRIFQAPPFCSLVLPSLTRPFFLTLSLKFVSQPNWKSQQQRKDRVWNYERGGGGRRY